MIYCPKCGTFSVAGDCKCLNCGSTVIRHEEHSMFYFNLTVFIIAILLFSGYFWAVYEGLII